MRVVARPAGDGSLPLPALQGMAGAVTSQGGYWPVNGTAFYASEGTHPTGVMVAIMQTEIPVARMLPPI